jgi:serpin B
MNPLREEIQNPLIQQLHELVNGEENLCYSPLSLNIALAMLHLGSTGRSREELEKLGVHELPKLDYSDKDLAPTDGEWGDPKAVVQYANSVWVRDDLRLRDAYKESVAESFGARVDNFNPRASQASADTINGWVSSRTAGKIKDLVPADSITPDSVAILVNAIYLRASWVEAFQEHYTVTKPFQAREGERLVDTMHQTEYMGHYKGEGAEAVSISLVGNYELVCVKADTLANAILDPLSLPLEYKTVELALPKFTIRSSLSLSETLQNLGTSALFQPSHDFQAMVEDVEEMMYVSDILQQTYIDVNEKGTEAAAATSVMLVAMSAMDPPIPVAVRFDRPFMYYLIDRGNGVVMFAGAVVDPTL